MLADGLQDVLDTTGRWLGVELFRVREVVVTPGSVLGVLLTLLAVVLISALVRRALTRYARVNPDASPATLYTLTRVTHYLLLVVGVVVAFDVIGVPLSQFSVFFGALGVGLGFGLQNLFGNFVSGLVLLFDRSLKVGDFVDLGIGIHGEVRDIGIRATRITTNDNTDILVPNAEFVNGRVTNWTLHETSRRIKVPFRVAYGSDKLIVRQAGLEAASAVSFTLAPGDRRDPQVWLASFDESAVNYLLVVWLNHDAVGRQGAVVAAYNWELESALARHGIRMPFAQRDLHLRSGFAGEELAAALAPASSTARRAAGADPDNDAALQVERDVAAQTAAREARRHPPAQRP